MRSRFHSALPDRSPRSLRHRAIGLVVVSLFSFQLSRFYLVIELDKFICLEATHTHGIGLGASTHHHDHEAGLSNPEEKGFFFQHCKDTFGGIALTPVQPLDVPVIASYPLPLQSGAALAGPGCPAGENDLAPPFQPPKVLS